MLRGFSQYTRHKLAVFGFQNRENSDRDREVRGVFSEHVQFIYPDGVILPRFVEDKDRIARHSVNQILAGVGGHIC